MGQSNVVHPLVENSKQNALVQDRIAAYIAKASAVMEAKEKVPDPNLLIFVSDDARLKAYRTRCWTRLLTRTVAICGGIIAGSGAWGAIFGALRGVV